MAPTVQGTVIVIMGVSGAGKTKYVLMLSREGHHHAPTVSFLMDILSTNVSYILEFRTIGTLLAEAENCTFLDADDFHPDSNKEKMKKGIPLSEEDRLPWLQLLCDALKEHVTSGRTAVLACSALRMNYREILRSSDPNYIHGKHSSSVKFVLLKVPAEVLTDRLHKRLATGEHYMPPSLLQSQLELLEIDTSEGILQADATQNPAVIVGTIREFLNQGKVEWPESRIQSMKKL